jgi:hypothetical protein
MRVIKAIVKWSAIVLAGFIALAIVLAIVDPPDDTESPETRATATPEVAATGEPTPTATAERTPQLTETERTARRIARDFRENFSGTSWYPEDHEFASDLDPLDGSIEIRTQLFPDAEGEQFATQIAQGVLGVGFPDICKVDVIAADGTRLVEHESQGAGC